MTPTPTGRTRVLWLIKGLGPGGAEQLLAASAQVADHERFDYTAAYLRPDKTHLVPVLAACGVDAVRITEGPQGRWRWPWRLRHLAGQNDVVHAHSPLPASVLRLVVRTLPRSHRPAVVTTEHNMWGSFTLPTRVLNRLTAGLDDHRFAVSEQVRDSMSPARARSTQVLHHGIHHASIDSSGQARREQTRAALGIGPDQVVAITVANLRREKDYPNLLHAARRALDARRQLRILAVGQGPLKAEVHALHDELRLGEGLRLLGYRDDVPALLAACDIFVLGSAHEGLPVAIMEAMAAGLPVVATDVGGVSQAVEDGVTGRLVPPSDPVALADALVGLADDPAERARMRDAALARAGDFDISTAVRIEEEVYEHLAHPAGTGPMSSDDAAEVATDLARSARWRFKQLLAATHRVGAASDATLLIHHRIGGGTRDELDLPPDAFAEHVRILENHDVVSLDTALDRLDAGDRSASVVLTFDDGFVDVYEHAWPLLRERRMPFTIYLASGFVGRPMRWEGSTATGAPGMGLSWRQLAEMLDSGLCTVGNHTHDHVPPAELTPEQLDLCSASIEENLGLAPRHFTYPWGVAVPAMEDALRARFRSASTGELGRNDPACDRIRLARVPVRRTDPVAFFAAKLTGDLWPERAYGQSVRVAKALGARA